MPSTPMQRTRGESVRLWTGRVLSAFVILFLLADGGFKIALTEPVRQATTELGYPLHHALTIGIIALVCAALYAIPRTCVLGAVLITGLCGGAVASQLRIGSPLGSHVLFGVYVAGMAWLGIWLRHAPLRAVLPLRRR